jgi:hypothetical protein
MNSREATRVCIREKMDIIRSSMFLKTKVYPDGKPDKLKARLVAGGNQQDRTLYCDDLSAPTVSTSAVLTILSFGSPRASQGGCSGHRGCVLQC